MINYGVQAAGPSGRRPDSSRIASAREIGWSSSSWASPSSANWSPAVPACQTHQPSHHRPPRSSDSDQNPALHPGGCRREASRRPARARASGQVGGRVTAGNPSLSAVDLARSSVLGQIHVPAAGEIDDRRLRRPSVQAEVLAAVPVGQPVLQVGVTELVHRTRLT